jgi:hypothetical protein
MAEEQKRPANVPSSLYGKGGVKGTPAREYVEKNARPFFPIGGELIEAQKSESKLPLLISVLALLVAVMALMVSMQGTGGIGKAQLSAIATDLEKMQGKQMEVGAPVASTVFIDKEIPLSEVIPDFTVPVDIVVPIQGTYNGITPTGTIRVTLNESVPMRLNIPVKSSLFATKNIRINKEIPVNVYASARFTVRELYGKEFQDIIDRIRNASK